jgi:uncharacterized protein
VRNSAPTLLMAIVTLAATSAFAEEKCRSAARKESPAATRPQQQPRDVESAKDQPAAATRSERHGPGHGPPLGRGFGRGRGPGRRGDADFDADHPVFEFLLDNRDSITRKVTKRKDGVETVTESQDPKVAAKIREHVAAMYKRVTKGNPIHMRDPLFREVFRHADQVKFVSESTKHGIRVVETSDDPYVAELIKAHADVVSKFIKHGHHEVRQNHAVPDRPAAASSDN